MSDQSPTRQTGAAKGNQHTLGRGSRPNLFSKSAAGPESPDWRRPASIRPKAPTAAVLRHLLATQGIGPLPSAGYSTGESNIDFIEESDMEDGKPLTGERIESEKDGGKDGSESTESTVDEEGKEEAEEGKKQEVAAPECAETKFHSRPSDTELFLLFRLVCAVSPAGVRITKGITNSSKHKEFSTDVKFHFPAAVDLWCVIVFTRYYRSIFEGGQSTSSRRSFASDFLDLCNSLNNEMAALRAEKSFPPAYGQPGSWQYLDQQDVVCDLARKPYHNRLFSVLDKGGFAPHHWSAILFVRAFWCRNAACEPKSVLQQDYKYTKKSLCLLEFVIKQFVSQVSGDHYGASYLHSDNKSLIQHLLEASEAFSPGRSEIESGDVWWNEKFGKE
ncbi:hypothetical protein BJ508DRAFT_311282 [Ascobolus immersus RN42]|uniref:Uncharacterized protein n=1 Tax=Ascobolus immersus RN42 TaxID=1160509 RepID=A0A3N4HQR8_ASCIM|nr:hypothetical protein BJ508DRAFT_311282 [Ascobolus immersus RN42]